MARRQFSWTEHQFDKLNKVQKVLGELHQYKPLTLRQIYYQLVGKEIIANKVSEYGMLSKLLKQARLDGYIPWEDVEDRTRVLHTNIGYDNKEDFIRQETEWFLDGYTRNRMMSQDVYGEVWIEKDSLSTLFTRTCRQYQIPVVVCKGFSSISFLNDFRNRLLRKGDQEPVMLYFGDFDPSGVEMLEAMKITLRNELGVNEVEFKRIALVPEDISTYKLPHNPSAIKKQDTRAKKHIAQFGELAVELDALPPDVLIQKIEDAIKAEIDIEKYRTEISAEKEDLVHIYDLKDSILKNL
ncbi:hypothetical protein IIB79_04355 [candidate division KSB1 bacterium]|nr:hypothetical protein [candidate division KSB1 bacterium]